MMEKVFCQSCGMPMESEEVFGTEAGGEKSGDYCVYCYQNGTFTEDCTVDEMIEACVPHMVKNGMDEDEARGVMQKFLPALKRWR